VQAVCDAGFDEVLVVLGFEHERVRQALAGLPVRFAINLHYDAGKGSSFRTAVEHLPDSEAALFALADQPFITSAEYRAVLDAWRRHAAPIVSVQYGDVTAPPHLFTRGFFPELAELEHGARPVLERHREKRHILTFPADRLMDLDTPEDYERIKQRLSSALR
jgi:CTP:molybdopterin cytidylyltransferase MocA